MAASLINTILAQVKKLDRAEQLNLLQKLTQMLQRNKNQKTTLSSISGIGSEIWKDTEIDAYVDEQRQW